jgi:hypothetical protein
MENAPANFTKATTDALLFCTMTILALGSLSYAAYAQYTESIILLNLEAGLLTYIV